jgi:hypothetical protein
MSFGQGGGFSMDFFKQQLMPWTGSSNNFTNAIGNVFAPGVYTAYGTYTDRKEEIAQETAGNEQAAAAIDETKKATAKKELLDAAAAEAEKLRRRRGMKATMLSGGDTGSESTTQAQALG